MLKTKIPSISTCMIIMHLFVSENAWSYMWYHRLISSPILKMTKAEIQKLEKQDAQ